ncbi:MAG: hypothetical protein QG653_489, partial [Patescibacteria group bacterium]|nr:hypothetical protein [Patescibacteria group bacterium]
VGASETWVFKFDLIYTNSSNATPDFAMSILGASGWTCNYTIMTSDTGAVGAQGSDCDNAPTTVSIQPADDNGIEQAITIQGRITSTTAGTVQLRWAQRVSSGSAVTIYQGSQVTAQKVGGVDLAEMYYSTDPLIEPGTVVRLDSSIPGGVQVTTTAYDREIFGVISTRPGYVLGDNSTNATDTPVLVALAGRVPVKVSTENGEIKPGDLLTSASIPGFAMRATKAGNIIGQAMTGVSSTNATGTVTMFIKPGYANGTDAQDLLARDTNASSTEGQPIATRLFTQFVSQVNNFASTTSGLSEVLADRVGAALEIITPKLLTNEVATEKITSATGNDVTIELTSGKNFKLQAIVAGTSTATTTATLATFDTLGNADFAGNLSAEDIFARGNLSVDSLLTIGAGGIQSSGNTAIDGNFFVGTTTGVTLFANAETKQVGVGTTTGEATLYVQANVNDNPFIVASSSGENLFAINANGNVAIGQATSSATLSVQANSATNDVLSIISQNENNLFTVSATGNVGFGTSTPVARADIWGNVNIATGSVATLFVNTATGVVGIGNNGTALDDEKLRVSGRIRATGFDVDSAADLAENFPAEEAVDPGTVVAFSTSTVAWSAGSDPDNTDDVYQMSMVRKANDGQEAIGIVSTNAGIVLGKRVANAVPVAFAGRVPVKVSLENGEIKTGDYLTVSETRPGYAMKLTGEGRSIGRAMSNSIDGREKVLVLVENGYQKVDLNGRLASTTAMLTMGNIDLNANGVAIYNIKSLASANGTWSIDENGRITAKELCVGDNCLNGEGLADVIATSKKSGSLQVIGNYTYILNAKAQTLTVLDISQSETSLIATINVPEKVTSMSSSGSYIYLTNDDLSKIILIDIGIPTNPTIARIIDTGTASPQATQLTEGTSTTTDETAGNTSSTTDVTATTGTSTSPIDTTVGGTTGSTTDSTSTAVDQTATIETDATSTIDTITPVDSTATSDTTIDSTSTTEEIVPTSPVVDPTATSDQNPSDVVPSETETTTSI